MKRFELLFFRLLRSILNLRQVLQSSAHWLLLLDKSQYYHDQSKPFLLTVNPSVLLHVSAQKNDAVLKNSHVFVQKC